MPFVSIFGRRTLHRPVPNSCCVVFAYSTFISVLLLFAVLYQKRKLYRPRLSDRTWWEPPRYCRSRRTTCRASRPAFRPSVVMKPLTRIVKMTIASTSFSRRSSSFQEILRREEPSRARRSARAAEAAALAALITSRHVMWPWRHFFCGLLRKRPPQPDPAAPIRSRRASAVSCPSRLDGQDESWSEA